ncbi:MAG: hypothetical protein QM808_09540 [Steroidobacteraceae bacterium]
MNMKSTRAPLALCAASLLMLSGYATAQSTGELSVAAGATQVINKTTSVTQLTVGNGATLTAPSGYGLTMTVNGVTTTIKPGTYKGKVVLTPTEDFSEKFTDMGLNDTYRYRAALYIDNGAKVPSKSVESAIVGGTVTNTEAKNISITSNEDKFNGIFITGNSKYTITKPKIRLTGNGGNDFVGFGAAIKTAGNAQVDINNADIRNVGVVRTGIFVGGNSVVNVNNSYIEVRNGTLPADYLGGPITGKGGVMMEPPWVMGIAGNVRATNVVENGEVHYNNSRIKAEGWGALSTDATKNVKLFCKGSTIEVTKSGYGAYADGVSMDSFSGCTLKTPDYGLIVTGGSALLTDKTVIKSDRIAIMTHSSGSGTITIDKGTVLNSKQASIQVKSSFNKIVVDNATFNTGSRVILESVVNDDPFAGAGMGAGAAGPGGMGGGAPGGAPPGGGGAPPAGAAPGGPPGGAAPAGGGARFNEPAAGPRVISASFSNVNLKGDIIHSMTSLGGMTVSITDATITGGISSSNAVQETKPTEQTLKLVGVLKQTFAPVSSNGVEVTLGRNGKWIANKTSYLSALTIADGASLTAPKGYSLSLTVDGRDTPIKTGNYKGAVVVKVSKS